MPRQFDRKIVLEDESQYFGYGFGGTGDRVCELVFNTSMVGYQEIISDPSHAYQMVVMTYPIIGNYGMTDDDFESRVSSLGALVVRKYNNSPSNFRYTKTLAEILEENRIPAIYGIDTRMLTRSIRDFGSRRAIITDASVPVEDAAAIIRQTPAPHNPVSSVSCKKRWYSRTSNHVYNVVAVDCGIKLSTVKWLNTCGCNVTVVPYDTTADDIAKISPDGIIISSGPGDPKEVNSVVELVRDLRGNLPIFGICLGHQLIALSYGADTYKLKYGHRGSNHPVRDIRTGRIEITSQNHGYAVDSRSLTGTGLELTHVNLLDGTAEGLACERDHVVAVQYLPSGSPGFQNSSSFFGCFAEHMREVKNNAEKNRY